MQIGILEPDNFSVDALRSLSEIGSVSLYDKKDLLKFLAPLDVLFVRLGYKLDASFLSQLPNLKFLCSPTTGHTHIDERFARDNGVEIISLRGQRSFLETVRATPEHTFGLILALLRRYNEALYHVPSGEWDRDCLRGYELYGKTVGIIGLGRVGYRVAKYCDPFGAKVFYYDIKSVKAEKHWSFAKNTLSLIQSSDVIVLCASYENGEPPIMDMKEIQALEGKYFINTARGELVNEDLLLEQLEAKALSGAAIDVISDELDNKNFRRWSSLAKGVNVIITPHMAGATINSMARTEEFIVNSLKNKIK